MPYQCRNSVCLVDCQWPMNTCQKSEKEGGGGGDDTIAPTGKVPIDAHLTLELLLVLKI